jgi:hypothetical protein
MRDCLGFSVGATHLVAARADGSATLRPAAVTWRGEVLKGFVERIGDPVPIVAPDGSAHSAERLLSHALSDLVNAAGGPREGMSIAVPAHWPEHVVARLRAVAPGVPVVSDATAALTALRANPGLPARGVVMLCDFGASGTNITLADAGRAFQPIGPTTRYDDFSGELVDRSVLTHLLDDADADADADVDPARTSAVASLAGFREHCRAAKERLSYQTATGLPGPVPGSTVRITRAELEALLQEPLDGLFDAIDDTLRRAGVLPSSLAAVATVGGGAHIPLVTQRLSQALRMPVTTTPDAQTVAAIGAALLAGREPESATRVVAAPQTGTLLASAVPAVAALAWSQESAVDDPVLDLDWQDEQWARPEVEYEPHQGDDEAAAPALPWYQRPALLFAGAACAVVLASVGLVVSTNTDAANASASAPLVGAAPATSQAQLPSAVAAGPSTVVTQTVVENGAPNVVTYTRAAPARQEPAPYTPAPAPQVPLPAPEVPLPTPEVPPPAPVTTTPTTTSTTPTTTSTTPTTTSTVPASTPTSTSTSTNTPTSSSSEPPPPPAESSSAPSSAPHPPADGASRPAGGTSASR